MKISLKSSSFSHANTILLLDDEFDITTVLKLGLQKRGFHIFAFTDPLLALEHFEINFRKYGFVISDLRMPGMNGFEFVKKVKEIRPEIKVFLMTAFEIDDAEFRRVLQSVQIDEFIQKPISFEGMAEIIRKHIDIRLEA